jgi:hypothetical protein
MSEGELGGFGDARLRRVGVTLLTLMERAPSMCLHALAADRNQALQFGRFLDNPAVSADEMLVRAGQLTAARAAGRHVLAIHDTTELHFQGHQAKRGFGPAGNGQGVGLFLHPVVALDAGSGVGSDAGSGVGSDAGSGGVIGLVGAQVLNRTEGKVATARRARGADAKESRRWLAGAETAAAVLEGAASITMVADRESDIYDYFARRPASVHLLCRAAQDRALEDGGRLFAEAASWEPSDRQVIALPQRGGHPARSATVALRFGQVVLQRPATAARSLPHSVTVWLVDVAEIDPPPDQPGVHWRLLTTHAVESVADARRVVGWYRARWTIEQVFRTLKSAGAQAETSQVVQARRFAKLAVVALIAAVRIVQLVLGRDGGTGQGLSDVAEAQDVPALVACNAKLEGRTDKLKNPHAPDTLAWFAWIVARLGGWSGYTSKGYKPPGPKTIARGLIKLDGVIQGWHLAHSAHVRLP